MPAAKRQKTWTEEELQYLEDNYKDMPAADVAAYLHRSVKSVSNKASRLGLASPDRRSEVFAQRTGNVLLTDDQKKYMRKWAGKKTCAQIARELGIGKSTCWAWMNRHIPDKKRSPCRHWTEEDEFALEADYEHMSAEALAKKFHRSVTSVTDKACSMGITFPNRACLSVQDLADVFGVSIYKVRRWHSSYGLQPCNKRANEKSSRAMLFDAEDFWAWAGRHRKQVPLDHYERGSLIPEPDWLKECRLPSDFA